MERFDHDNQFPQNYSVINVSIKRISCALAFEALELDSPDRENLVTKMPTIARITLFDRWLKLAEIDMKQFLILLSSWRKYNR